MPADVKLLPPPDSNVLTLVLNEALGCVNEPDMFVAVNDLISVALTPNEPDMPAAVKPLPPPPSSNEVTLVLNEELAGVKDPLIPADVNGEANAPEISDAI